MADDAYAEDVMGYEVFVDECLDSPSYDTGSHPANLQNLLPDSKSNELSTESDISEFMLDDINSCPSLVQILTPHRTVKVAQISSLYRIPPMAVWISYHRSPT